MEIIVLVLMGLITLGGGPGDKEKHLICPIEVVQNGKLVKIEGDCDDAARVTPPPVCVGCEPPPPPPPPCENCHPNPHPDKVKSDNSDANGKGGNKHNRTDKDKPAQEIAENKKAG